MPEDSMNLEDLARYTSLSTAPVKSIQAALDFEQAMHQVQEQNLDGFYANIEQVNKDLLHMADEQESAKRETMKWSEMTPEQRDRLVHERVMGHSPDEPCEGIFWAATNTQTGESGSQCDGCGVYYPADDTIDKHQQPNVPSYTTDMNAAWLVLAKILELDDQDWSGELRTPFAYHLGVTYVQERYNMPIDTFEVDLEQLVALKPERICLAALKSVGVTID